MSIIVVIVAISLGARIGGIGVAFAAGAGLYVLTMILGLEPGVIPISVVLIIMAVIGAIALLELSGGLDYVVKIATNLLRKNPKHINVLAPLVSFCLTTLAGTGHANYSVMPIIVEIAKNQGIKPVRPLTSSVVASQIAVTSSPISAAMIAMLGFMEPLGIHLGQLLLILLPSGLLGSLLLGYFQGKFLPQDLSKDKEYLNLLATGSVKEIKIEEKKIPAKAPYCLLAFLLVILVIVIYGIFGELKLTYKSGNQIDTASLIVILMFSGSFIMWLITKININNLASQSTFKAGMSAALCVIGVAWLGDTIVSNYKLEIMEYTGSFLQNNSWALALIFFVISMLLYSQAAAFIAVLPIITVLHLPPLTIIASFAAVSALFVLPTYPTLIAAVSMDYTKTTKIGKYVLNHSFLIPGILGIIFSVIFAYIIGSLVI